ncbi:adenylyl-sulfate kinase [Halobacillus litoralis]|uniref:Adenylyl-sulfate kinase n=1 Tax=Halobacillus litoralis TaxID=45668 RepID=A0A845DRH5_9BACI|nr:MULTISPECIES: adenylyl-sulfate kinase [Halobacillus]MYL19145.1 adenylyl-sulfate kinase [Halobacillus litoralis]MYL28291.1 adenylyl-sulfate kinase [Halobacillus halophilus]MYL37777.1 adenylyl-sulfate kinase [Halobacillus litoralis]
MATNLTWHEAAVQKQDYRRKNGHYSGVLWFTGLSGAGKSSIANHLNRLLFEHGIQTYLLDGDNVRHGLNQDLGFSEADRAENIRRIGEVSKLFTDNGSIVLTAFISPYRQDRDRVRSLLAEEEFIEVFVDCPVEECESRDPKGLYKKARAGEISGFTGVDAPYEAPVNPECIVRSDQHSIQACAEQIFQLLIDKKWLNDKEG